MSLARHRHDDTDDDRWRARLTSRRPDAAAVGLLLPGPAVGSHDAPALCRTGEPITSGTVAFRPGRHADGGTPDGRCRCWLDDLRAPAQRSGGRR